MILYQPDILNQIGLGWWIAIVCTVSRFVIIGITGCSCWLKFIFSICRSSHWLPSSSCSWSYAIWHSSSSRIRSWGCSRRASSSSSSRRRSSRHTSWGGLGSGWGSGCSRSWSSCSWFFSNSRLDKANRWQEAERWKEEGKKKKKKKKKKKSQSNLFTEYNWNLKINANLFDTGYCLTRNRTAVKNTSFLAWNCISEGTFQLFLEWFISSNIFNGI